MKRLTVIVIICMALAVSSGCAAILESETRSERLRVVTPSERLSSAYELEAANYYELAAHLLELVMRHEESGRIVALIYSYDGDVHEDFERARLEIQNNHPVGAFAVYEIDGTVTQTVSYFEIEVSIEYRRTRRQVESIVPIASTQQLRNELYGFMSEYAEEAAIRTSLRGVTAEYVENLVREIYFENPRSIVMLPIVTALAFPENHGDDKVIELIFGNMEDSYTLRQRSEELAENVRHNAERAVGDTDAEILLSLANILIDAADFDEGAARGLSAHGVQSFAATAYGALISEAAVVGEGFAMAFKALCDERGINSQVVLGYLDGMFHAWNRVSLDGEYYFIDIAMGVVNGIETTFLKTGAEFIAMGYVWQS